MVKETYKKLILRRGVSVLTASSGHKDKTNEQTWTRLQSVDLHLDNGRPTMRIPVPLPILERHAAHNQDTYIKRSATLWFSSATSTR